MIISRHLNEKSQPVPMPQGLAQQLLGAGYSRLVIGHTPHGNCPTVVPGPVQVIMADTSYSDMKAPDNRGEAASVRARRVRARPCGAHARGVCALARARARRAVLSARRRPRRRPALHAPPPAARAACRSSRSRARG